MPNTTTPQVSVRLDAETRAMVTEMQAMLATPLRPGVTIAETIRAAVRETHGRYAANTARIRPNGAASGDRPAARRESLDRLRRLRRWLRLRPASERFPADQPT